MSIDKQNKYIKGRINMVDYQTKQNLKSYLISNDDIVGSWDFEKTERFCINNDVDFKEVMFEVIHWENTFGNGVGLDDSSLLFTVL